jgi:hypothetical protein
LGATYDLLKRPIERLWTFIDLDLADLVNGDHIPRPQAPHGSISGNARSIHRARC